MGTARDECDLLTGGGQFRAEIAADGSRADYGDFHRGAQLAATCCTAAGAGALSAAMRARNGFSTSSASAAAMKLRAAAEKNTTRQLPLAANTLVSGTSNAAVPFAV